MTHTLCKAPPPANCRCRRAVMGEGSVQPEARGPRTRGANSDSLSPGQEQAAAPDWASKKRKRGVRLASSGPPGIRCPTGQAVHWAEATD